MLDGDPGRDDLCVQVADRLDGFLHRQHVLQIAATLGDGDLLSAGDGPPCRWFDVDLLTLGIHPQECQGPPDRGRLCVLERVGFLCVACGVIEAERPDPIGPGPVGERDGRADVPHRCGHHDRGLGEDGLNPALGVRHRDTVRHGDIVVDVESCRCHGVLSYLAPDIRRAPYALI